MTSTRRAVRNPVFAGALLVAGCAHGLEASSRDEPAQTPSRVTASAPLAEVATVPRGPRIDSYASITSFALKKCEPGEKSADNSELKRLQGEANACLRHRMEGELEAVLLPLREQGSPRFQPLMKEQALFDQFADALGGLVEQEMWISLEFAERSFGSAYDSGRLMCTASSSKERLYYARTLNAEDPASLASRIELLQKDGELTQGRVREMGEAAERWLRTLVPASTQGEQYAGPEDWRAMANGVRAVELKATELAASTCAGVPGLSAALDGAESCREKTRRYYFAHCEFLD